MYFKFIIICVCFCIMKMANANSAETISNVPIEPQIHYRLTSTVTCKTLITKNEIKKKQNRKRVENIKRTAIFSCPFTKKKKKLPITISADDIYCFKRHAYTFAF